MKNNQDIIDGLKEELDRGESSLGTLMDIAKVLRDHNKDLYNKFSDAYTMYANDDVEIDEDLLEEVYKELGEAPEFKEEKSSVQKLMDSLD